MALPPGFTGRRHHPPFCCSSPLDPPERCRPEHFSYRPERSARYPIGSKVPSGPIHSQPLVSVTTPSWARINPFGSVNSGKFCQSALLHRCQTSPFAVRPRRFVLAVTPHKPADTLADLPPSMSTIKHQRPL